MTDTSPEIDVQGLANSLTSVAVDIESTFGVNPTVDGFEVVRTDEEKAKIDAVWKAVVNDFASIKANANKLSTTDWQSALDLGIQAVLRLEEYAAQLHELEVPGADDLMSFVKRWKPKFEHNTVQHALDMLASAEFALGDAPKETRATGSNIAAPLSAKAQGDVHAALGKFKIACDEAFRQFPNIDLELICAMVGVLYQDLLSSTEDVLEARTDRPLEWVEPQGPGWADVYSFLESLKQPLMDVSNATQNAAADSTSPQLSLTVWRLPYDYVLLIQAILEEMSAGEEVREQTSMLLDVASQWAADIGAHYQRLRLAKAENQPTTPMTTSVEALVDVNVHSDTATSSSSDEHVSDDGTEVGENNFDEGSNENPNDEGSSNPSRRTKRSYRELLNWPPTDLEQLRVALDKFEDAIQDVVHGGVWWEDEDSGEELGEDSPVGGPDPVLEKARQKWALDTDSFTTELQGCSASLLEQQLNVAILATIANISGVIADEARNVGRRLSTRCDPRWSPDRRVTLAALTRLCIAGEILRQSIWDLSAENDDADHLSTLADPLPKLQESRAALAAAIEMLPDPFDAESLDQIREQNRINLKLSADGEWLPYHLRTGPYPLLIIGTDHPVAAGRCDVSVARGIQVFERGRPGFHPGRRVTNFVRARRAQPTGEVVAYVADGHAPFVYQELREARRSGIGKRVVILSTADKREIDVPRVWSHLPTEVENFWTMQSCTELRGEFRAFLENDPDRDGMVRLFELLLAIDRYEEAGYSDLARAIVRRFELKGFEDHSRMRFDQLNGREFDQLKVTCLSTLRGSYSRFRQQF